MIYVIKKFQTENWHISDVDFGPWFAHLCAIEVRKKKKKKKKKVMKSVEVCSFFPCLVIKER